MKKLLLLTITILLSAALFASPSREHNKRITGENKRITLELEGNPTTGYSWTYTTEPEGIIKEVSSEYQPDKAAAGRTGAGGKFIFVFEGLAPGETKLTFRYTRPWENAEPEKIQDYIITVDGKGNINSIK